MISRTYDSDIVLAATDQYKEHLTHVDFREWLDDHDNLALTNEDGDVTLFTRDTDTLVCGHLFFHCRGRRALDTAAEMLSEAFTGPYNIKAIRALIPLQNLGARWVTKRLGFRSFGAHQSIAGPTELMILTKAEWLEDKEKHDG
jgi:hypothetical protein